MQQTTIDGGTPPAAAGGNDLVKIWQLTRSHATAAISNTRADVTLPMNRLTKFDYSSSRVWPAIFGLASQRVPSRFNYYVGRCGISRQTDKDELLARIFLASASVIKLKISSPQSTLPCSLLYRAPLFSLLARRSIVLQSGILQTTLVTQLIGVRTSAMYRVITEP